MTAAAPPPPATSTHRLYWWCQLGGWGANAAFQLWALFFLASSGTIVIIAGVVKDPIPTPPPEPGMPWATALLQVLVLNVLALAFSHALRGFIRRRAWDRKSWLALLPRVLITGLLLSLPVGYAESFTYVTLLHQPPPEAPEWLKRLQQSIQWAPLFWGWMFLYFMILANRRRSEITRELQAAQLRLLKSQLNPHFLFNALNTVRALISADPSRARDAVTQLARTLRYALSSGQEELVSLKQELEIVDDYLAIEALRLGERLRIERDLAPATLQTRIPVMLLQTVVENAIKHGIAELPEGGTLRIAGRIAGGGAGVLELQIENPRPRGMPAAPGEGVGLRNGSERLRLLFGDAAGLDLDLSQPEWAVTRIRIPVTA